MHTLRAIDSPDMLRAVAEPHRLEILRRVMVSPQTLSSLGAALDKHPAWIRHHVKVLEAAGLVELVEERQTRNYIEKFYSATAAAFTLSLLIRPQAGEGGPIVALASHDFAFELLTDACAQSGQQVAAGVAGSLDSLIAVRQGLADIAGCHLIDFETGQYNVPYVRRVFPDRDIVLVTLAYREQGLIVASGNPLGLTSFSDIAEKQGRFVNRNRGSGTRLVIDHAAAALSRPFIAHARAPRGVSSYLAIRRAFRLRIMSRSRIRWRDAGSSGRMLSNGVPPELSIQRAESSWRRTRRQWAVTSCHQQLSLLSSNQAMLSLGTAV